MKSEIEWNQMMEGKLYNPYKVGDNYSGGDAYRVEFFGDEVDLSLEQSLWRI